MVDFSEEKREIVGVDRNNNWNGFNIERKIDIKGLNNWDYLY